MSFSQHIYHILPSASQTCSSYRNRVTYRIWVLILITTSGSLMFYFHRKKYFVVSMNFEWRVNTFSLGNNSGKTDSDDFPLAAIVTCNHSDAEYFGAKYKELINSSTSWTACYSDDYLLQLYAADIGMADRDKDGMLFFDVGANKGYTTASWMAIWMPHLGINSRTLGNFVRPKNISNYCGACSDCTDTQLENLNLTLDTGRPIKIHAFEPQPSAFALLKEVKQWMNTSSLYIHNVALSNLTGTSALRNCSAGDETCALSDGEQLMQVPERFVQVNVTTMDEFVKQYRISRKIDVLKIDTEGFDPLTIEGAAGVLHRHQVRLLIFEYHSIGVWVTLSLERMIADLEKKAYYCYQLGRTGIFRLTGCWSSKFETKAWSNVLCVSRQDSRLMQFIEKLLIKR